ncbi:MAG: hypothetical protein V4598_10275 [Bdellovibrionota bacterium]
MNTQPNQNELNEFKKKKAVEVNPSRDLNYDDKEKDFSGEFGEQIDEEASEEINPSELDNSEVDLDRGGVEFSGGKENQEVKPNEQKLTGDLGGDKTKTSGPLKH